MNYLALYRKYRPTTFNGVVGQPQIIQILQNAIDQDKINHAYLFSGPRGTGKTSVAKIFATLVNKIGYERVNDSVDIVEIDAASNNGIPEVRKIIEQVKFLPSEFNYKVYIIDEVHMLSKGAFNALLKTLEEPPQRVIFILATTEPHKIPITILSRVQRLNFNLISNNEITETLKQILQKEAIPFEDEALKLISRMAKGSLRDALSIVDQVAIYYEGGIMLSTIDKLLGVVSSNKIIELVNNCFNQKVDELFTGLNILFTQGINGKQFIYDLVELIKDFIIYKKTNNENFLRFIVKDDIESIEFNIDYAYLFLEKLMKIIRISNNVMDLNQEIELMFLDVIKKIHMPKTVAKPIEKPVVIEQPKPSANPVQKLTPSPQIKKPIEPPSRQQEENDFASILSNLGKTKQEVKLTIKDLVQMSTSATIEKRIELKKKFLTINTYASDPEIEKYLKWLSKGSFITAGEDYLLVAIENDPVSLELINNNRETYDFLKFTEKVFGKPHLIFAMDKKDFTSLQRAFFDLKKVGSLPPKKTFIPPKPPKPEKVNEEKPKVEGSETKLSEIFGDKFEEE